jgi:hypothetical protein
MLNHPWGLFWPLWRAQDWLRRQINRVWYCSLGEHRRTDPDSPCKDCGA